MIISFSIPTTQVLWLSTRSREWLAPIRRFECHNAHLVVRQVLRWRMQEIDMCRVYEHCWLLLICRGTRSIFKRKAMLLKNKANRKEGRVTFNKTLAELSEMMKKSLAETSNASASVADIEKYIKTFDDFNIQAIKLENSYNAARTAAEEMIAIIKDFLFLAFGNVDQGLIPRDATRLYNDGFYTFRNVSEVVIFYNAADWE